MKDCVGNEIQEGDLLKVFHFVGARNKKYFMYKCAGKLRESGYREILHYPFGKEGYFLKKNSDIFDDAVVVYSETRFDFKRSKFHGA